MRTLPAACLSVAVLLAIGGSGHSSPALTVDHHAITVIDGDSIEFDKTVWQLSGIDAPELGQVCDHDGHLRACGLAAAYELRKFIGLAGASILCFPGKETDVTTLVTCTVGDEDISLMMVQSGHAAVIPGGPVPYSAAEHHARQASMGIWGSTFILPWEWRKGRRLPDEEPPQHHHQGTWDQMASSLSAFLGNRGLKGSRCVVKGVVRSTGARYYYGPLDKKYANITIDKKRGGRMFCSDDQARAAGWRREGERTRGR